MGLKRRAWIGGLAGLLLAGVGGPGGAQSPKTVTVFAAASLTDAFNEMGREFAKHNPGFQAQFSFAASSLLRTQIERGAPAGVFASADWEQMRPLVKGKQAISPRVFAQNRLVIIVPKANPARIKGVRDLGDRKLQLVMTDEKVPIGRYTREMLERVVASKIVTMDWVSRVRGNVVSREPNVRTLVTKVELGVADAAVVYESDALAGKRSGKLLTIAIPPSMNVVAEYPVVVLVGASEKAGAERFVAFVQSKDGRAILKRNGFR